MTREQIISGAIVTLIATLVGWLTNRASNKASMTNTVTSSRVEMEKEAYERARKLDTETITRQDHELKELEGKYDTLKIRFETVEELNRKLNDDVGRITHDNYQLHRENTRVLELNAQILADNERIRNASERVLRENQALHEELDRLRERVTKMQRGIDPDSTDPIRERETDTNHTTPEVEVG